jgi:hypothetical protein
MFRLVRIGRAREVRVDSWVVQDRDRCVDVVDPPRGEPEGVVRGRESDVGLVLPRGVE